MRADWPAGGVKLKSLRNWAAALVGSVRINEVFVTIGASRVDRRGVGNVGRGVVSRKEY